MRTGACLYSLRPCGQPFGRGRANPLEAIRWFDSKQCVPADGGALSARPLPVAARAALPRAFEELSLRVFLTEPGADALGHARAAFRRWADRRGLCDELCLVRFTDDDDDAGGLVS